MTARNARWLHAADALFLLACAFVFASRATAVLMAEGSSTWLLAGYCLLALIATSGSVLHLFLAVED